MVSIDFLLVNLQNTPCRGLRDNQAAQKQEWKGKGPNCSYCQNKEEIPSLNAQSLTFHLSISKALNWCKIQAQWIPMLSDFKYNILQFSLSISPSVLQWKCCHPIQKLFCVRRHSYWSHLFYLRLVVKSTSSEKKINISDQTVLKNVVKNVLRFLERSRWSHQTILTKNKDSCCVSEKTSKISLAKNKSFDDI